MGAHVGFQFDLFGVVDCGDGFRFLYAAERANPERRHAASRKA